MPLTYPLLRDGSLVLTATALELRIWLPWMRSLPWACVTTMAVCVGDVEVEPARVTVTSLDRCVLLEDLRTLPGYWVVGTSVLLRIEGEHVHEPVPVVRVEVGCVIPYIFDRSGPLMVTSRATTANTDH